jgi:hypothetical protein
MCLAKSHPDHPAQISVSWVITLIYLLLVSFFSKKKYIGRSELSRLITRLTQIRALFGLGGLYA